MNVNDAVNDSILFIPDKSVKNNLQYIIICTAKYVKLCIKYKII